MFNPKKRKLDDAYKLYRFLEVFLEKAIVIYPNTDIHI